MLIHPDTLLQMAKDRQNELIKTAASSRICRQNADQLYKTGKLRTSMFFRIGSIIAAFASRMATAHPPAGPSQPCICVE